MLTYLVVDVEHNRERHFLFDNIYTSINYASSQKITQIANAPTDGSGWWGNQRNQQTAQGNYPRTQANKYSNANKSVREDHGKGDRQGAKKETKA